ncbi:MAG: septum site-determining protein MinC [Acaryochloridaceae cyanobacterium SU_2_1]|nr:septum site-determining protein MinC [Acaryochloridaceae cyanobacterium SU_2_1]
MNPERLKTAFASPVNDSETEDSPRVAEVEIHLESEGGKLYLYLPSAQETTLNWSELLAQLQKCLDASQRFLPANTHVDLIAGDRLIDHRQLQSIVDSLSTYKLHLVRVHTRRRQTAVAGATSGYSIEQQSQILPMAQSSIAQLTVSGDFVKVEPLYLQTTLRSGSEIHHPGTVIIQGDLNPGSAVVADGDILVWGRLRGVAHAGASGNDQCRIMALQMEPTQLRIADYLARAPESSLHEFYPEVAFIAEDGIQIAPASEFSKNGK